MKAFSLIVAFDETRGIGKDGVLAWHLSADLKHFKEITTTVRDPSKTNAVIMGRKTWESLPPKFRPLPGRVNIVLTRQKDYVLPQGVLVFAELNIALERLSQQAGIDRVFVIGGAQLFDTAMDHPNCVQICVTEIQGNYRCDTFFPSIPSRFKPAVLPSWRQEGVYTYRFLDYN